MPIYKAAYRFFDDGIHGEVLDFPGVMSCGGTVDEVRRLLASALIDMVLIEWGEHRRFPSPNPFATSPDSDLEEPITVSTEFLRKT